MDDVTEADVWNMHRAERREKKLFNRKSSLTMLESLGIEYVTLNSAIGHYRIGEWDFWPSTGKFRNIKSGVTGRGVKKLIQLLHE
ncbi:MAG: hypothetical protein KW793_03615 [Candidatus Doudnabacteria bacterium]|nr:hypothetical protein [Candidatus Doudnabacteria bacterium]